MIPEAIHGANNNNINNNNNNNNEIAEISRKLAEMQKHIFSIEQYLRVNNIEVVGLPEPVDDETDESVLLEALNSLNDLNHVLTGDDIDIAHPVPSRRQDRKNVMICRFISRKAKIAVLDAKKKQRDFKFRNNNVYVNEH